MAERRVQMVRKKIGGKGPAEILLDGWLEADFNPRSRVTRFRALNARKWEEITTAQIVLVRDLSHIWNPVVGKWTPGRTEVYRAKTYAG